MATSLNPLRFFAPWRRDDAAKLYGAIVAQARLPVFYQSLGIPDRLDGRFLVLSINLFAVLHRLSQGGSEGRRLAQSLSDRFADDMETVLRELGTGDLAIAKQMRKLAASSQTLLQTYADASARGEEALAAGIAEMFPLLQDAKKDATLHLAHYLKLATRELETQPVSLLAAGEVRFPKVE